MIRKSSKLISFFIPIRKNSKRVINKNTKRIGNYKFGLTEIKLNQLAKFRKSLKKDNILKNQKFEYLVSSDDTRVQKFVKKYKWIKFHKRSPKLSSDDSLDKLILLVPKICKGRIILWTHVTSPFFNEKSFLLGLVFFKNIQKFELGRRFNII